MPPPPERRLVASDMLAGHGVSLDSAPTRKWRVRARSGHANNRDLTTLATIMCKTYILDMTAAQPDEQPDCVEVTVTDARVKLPKLIDTAVRDGAVVYLTRYGRRVGALVPVEVAERYEQWEDAYWSRRAAEVLRRDEPTVPWDQAVAELEAGDAGTGAFTP